MNEHKLSIDQGCLIGAIFLLSVSLAFLAMIFYLTDDRMVLWLGLLFVGLVILGVSIFVLFLRRQLVSFVDDLCRMIDAMTDDVMPPINVAENLFAKLMHRLSRLYEAMRAERQHIAKERADLQTLISDIAHQVKTPLANLQMMNATLLEQTMPVEKQREFLYAMDGQLEKLTFLMQAMIKTSRLEAGIIVLEKKMQPLYDTLAIALGGIVLSAEKKAIDVRIDHQADVMLPHDQKWTAEALFNILDNAVKYTQVGGMIRINVQAWEMYVKIDIIDNGKGIAEERQGMIFQRFYREEDVRDVDGIGIGLYLARQIITQQGGYITVTSAVGCGATFSVFLPVSE